MPAKSIAMQQAAAIALHHPSKLSKKNRSLKRMSPEQLREFASTPHAGLPQHSVPLTQIGHRAAKRK
jgi:hypothetical protein